MKIKNLWRQKYLMLHYFHKNTFLTVIRYEFLIGSHFYMALGSPIFPSGCEGKLGVVLESLQGRRDLT